MIKLKCISSQVKGKNYHQYDDGFTPFKHDFPLTVGKEYLVHYTGPGESHQLGQVVVFTDKGRFERLITSGIYADAFDILSQCFSA